ncbi:MAG: hypothetical protein ABJF01_19475 [bacterium]
MEGVAVILKTSPATIGSVLHRAKHATDKLPIDLQVGTLLLIHQAASGSTTPPRITHLMKVAGIRRDLSDETDKIWGRHWDWIIDGEGLREFVRPIPIGRLGTASGKNYGQGAQKFVYLETVDLVDLARSELFALKPI